MSSGPNGAAQLGVQCLDRVGRVDDPPHAFREGEEGDHEFPVAAPALRAGRILCAPRTLREGVDRTLASGGTSCPIDGAQRLRHALAIKPCDSVGSATVYWHNAGLNDGLQKHRVDRLQKALQSV